MDNAKKKRAVFAKIKGTLSILLLIVSVIVILTGIGLYLAPSGTSDVSGWRFLGLPKFKLERLHTVTGFIMAGLIAIHFSLNTRLLAYEFSNQPKSMNPPMPSDK